MLAFYREKPNYDHYWVIEYDVRYTGHWGELLSELRTSQAAFLGTTLQDHDENPRWWWWPSLVNTPNSSLQRVRCFTPFCRLSNAALAAVDKWYREGGSGHYELVWPGVCKTNGWPIEDIGGWGRYTPERWRGKHYVNTLLKPSLSPGIFVYKPVMLLLNTFLPKEKILRDPSTAPGSRYGGTRNIAVSQRFNGFDSKSASTVK